MAESSDREFVSGVVEGFYGPPWTPGERAELLEWMSAGGLNTYLYAPKDDVKHRAVWRELYEPSEAHDLAARIAACRARGIRFVYALSPGLDIRYNDAEELSRILARFEQLLTLGCEDFALLFDDIPDAMRDEDRQAYGSFAAAQVAVTNAVFRWVRERGPLARFFFCPTPYCQRMADRQLGGADYLETIGRELASEIDVFWTGPEIISREITVPHLRALQARLRRRPLIWDNLFANDYDGRRFYCGPYAGRPTELRDEVSGILCNPNTEFPLNFAPLRTFAAYCRAEGDWNPRSAYLAAMEAWLPRFATRRALAALDDLLLFGDAYYLPYEEGPEAEELTRAFGEFVREPESIPSEDVEALLCRAIRLKDFCAALADLCDRPLFYALHRRAWELREELDLLIGYVRRKQADPRARCASDFHLPGVYRGGIVAKLQRTLTQRPDGTLVPTADAER